MSQLSGLEDKLNKVFVDDAPVQLPDNAKKSIVQYLPIINLVLGLVTIWAAWSLWHWAHIADAWVDYANRINDVLGTRAAHVNRLSTMVWVSLIVLAAEGVLYVMAYPGLKAKKKAGWNLLFYAALLNAVYGIVSLFNDYGGAGSLVGSLVGSVIGLYILFQIRASYTSGKAATPAVDAKAGKK